MPQMPPEDAEDWTHEQWLAWLDETDNGVDPDDVDLASWAPPPAPSTGMQLLGGAMLGLEQALFGPREDDVVLIAPSDDPARPGDVEIHFDPDDPTRSWVRFADGSERPPDPR